jgi:hypothetical protein
MLSDVGGPGDADERFFVGRRIPSDGDLRAAAAQGGAVDRTALDFPIIGGGKGQRGPLAATETSECHVANFGGAAVAVGREHRAGGEDEGAEAAAVADPIIDQRIGIIATNNAAVELHVVAGRFGATIKPDGEPVAVE